MFGIDFLGDLFSGNFTAAGDNLVSGISSLGLDFLPDIGTSATSAVPKATDALLQGPENAIEIGGTALDLSTLPGSAGELFGESGGSSGLLDILSNKSVLTSLLLAGTGLGQQLLQNEVSKDSINAQKEEAQANRDFQREENTATRDLRREESAAAREEARINREFQAEQQAANREFQAEQEKARQRFNALVQLQNGRRTLLAQRAQAAGGGGGDNTAALFGNVASSLRS